MSERSGYDVAILIKGQNRTTPGLHGSEIVKMAGSLIDAHRRLYDLISAVSDIYFAAHWSPDRKCDAIGLWTRLRDAALIKPGSSTAALGPKRGANEETGWLIESECPSGMGGPLYLGLTSKRLGWGHDWFVDANEALRFSRKVDAEKFCRTYGHHFATAVSVHEHWWLGARP